ncbi:MAG: DUF302 domain-containing protein [Armatimonadota bacterium]|nr:DUF302 domain-containing protein [Armatimonadota bacterium]
MNVAPSAIGRTVRLRADHRQAIARVTDALKTEGFGVLTTIDVRETLKQKLNVEFRPYTILGACNPPLAYRALSVVPAVGLLLPCNVTVSEVEPGVNEVSLVDPVAMLGVIGAADLRPIAEEARARLDRVAALLEGE